MVRSILMLTVLAGLASAQDKKPQVFARNDKEGIEMAVPQAKDQMWSCAIGEGSFFGKNAAVAAKHRLDKFGVDAIVQRLAPNTKWPEGGPTEIAKGARESYTKPQEGEKEANFKECKVKESDDKAKFPGISGRCFMHKLELIQHNGGKLGVTEYFVLSSEVLYRISITYDDESYKKYWAGPCQVILANTKKCAVKKDK